MMLQIQRYRAEMGAKWWVRQTAVRCEMMGEWQWWHSDHMDTETITETRMRTQELLPPPPNTSLASPASSPWPGLEITNTSLLWPWLDLDWSRVLDWDHQECHHWQPVHHLYYQASQAPGSQSRTQIQRVSAAQCLKIFLRNHKL